MDALWLAIRPAGPPSPSEFERLACWAGAFTPRVSIVDGGLLLEIGTCLRLFGSLDTLRHQVTQGLADQGIAAGMAVAATPQAALWLAEGVGDELDTLAITAITWPAGVQEKLIRFGLRRLGEVRQLSMASLARRVGKQAVTLLARAYGEVPDPRPDFAFPQRFGQAIELPAPVESAPALLFAARRLTAALAGWLAVQQTGLRACRLDLVHRQGATPLTLRFAEATRDGSRFERVLRERLGRLQLAAPVETLYLAAEDVEDLPGRSGGLFDDGLAKESMAALIERLRARLGEERVFGIAPAADHRPECATHRNSSVDQHPIKSHGGPCQVCPGPLGGGGGEAAASGGSLFPARPFWLLAAPEPLHEVGGRPHRRGPLQLIAGPERIEAGWWQEGETGAEGVGDCRRDYFIAMTADARWAWIFRELRAPGGWFLHGWFA